jgi:hypothetical protein
VASAHQLPAQFQDGFVGAFSGAARGGLEIGAGQTGSSLPIPLGLPGPLVQQLQQLAHTTFTHAFVDAMRPTLVLPIMVIVAAALVACTARGRSRTEPEPAPEREAVAATR